MNNAVSLGMFPIVFLIVYMLIIGLGLYIAYLVIKALKIYIKNNETKEDEY